MTPKLRAALEALGVAIAFLVAARFLVPLLLGGPPAGSAAWIAWFGAAAPWAAAAGCAVAVQRLGGGWGERWVVTAVGWGLGAGGVAVLLSPFADVAPLFPVAALVDTWEPMGTVLVDPVHGVLVEPDGALLLGVKVANNVATEVHPDALAATAGVASLAVWAPLVVCVPGRAGSKMGAVAVALATTVLLFHAVAANRVEPVWLPLAGAPLAVVAATQAAKYQRSSRARTNRRADEAPDRNTSAR